MSDKNESLEVMPRDLPPPATAEALISEAIQKGVSVETMERLMAMRRELRAESAKAAFDQAMSDFQSDCPIIEKKRKVMNKDGQSVRYSYAPLDSIISQVRELLKKHGFGYRIVPEVTPNEVAATCVVTHSLGHSESASFKVPIDPGAFMNKPQQFASALTFAKRYAFCAAFGVVTGEEDDDAATASISPEEDSQRARWAKPSSSSSSSAPKAKGNPLKAKLWAMCQRAGAETVAEAEANLLTCRILAPSQTLAGLDDHQMQVAIEKLSIILEEQKKP